jgi:hypothetical protein
MKKSFEERLRAIEARMRKKPGAGTFSILEISGCPPGPINHAAAEDLSWKPDEGEELEAFVERAAQAAFRAGKLGLIVGGLPSADVYAQYRKPDGEFDFDRWWQEVAARAPEIPPCEGGRLSPAGVASDEDARSRSTELTGPTRADICPPPDQPHLGWKTSEAQRIYRGPAHICMTPTLEIRIWHGNFSLRSPSCASESSAHR